MYYDPLVPNVDYADSAILYKAHIFISRLSIPPSFCTSTSHLIDDRRVNILNANWYALMQTTRHLLFGYPYKAVQRGHQFRLAWDSDFQ